MALFFVFRTLFTDGPSDPWHPEYLFAHFLNFVAYAAAAFVALRWAKPGPLLLVPLLLPAAIIVGIYAEPSVAMRTLTFAVAVLGAGAGAWLGGALRGRALRDG